MLAKNLSLSVPGLSAVLLIASGALLHRAAAAEPAARSLWSIEPLARPALPPVKESGWARTPADAFILAGLEERGLRPSSEATRAELLRRAALDLTGLLPEPEDLEEHLADASPDAFERAIDRLLASPRHGERWARHWLDLARYAESEGFKSDEVRPHAWRYRDYVIRSLNADKPYDRFVAEQVAGDELWPDEPEARLATAFNRHYPDESNARDLMQRRQEILNDITDTATQVFTGLTFGCARCHDHKTDPILQRDYYALQAFFANVRAEDAVPLVPPDDLARHKALLGVWEEKTAAIRSAMREIEEPKRKAIADDNFSKFPGEIQEAIRKPGAERTAIEWQMYYKALPYLHPEQGTILGALKEAERKTWQGLADELKQFASFHPGDLPLGSAIVDASRDAPPTHILAGGVHTARTVEVEPAFPSVFKLPPPRLESVAGASTTGRRSALARWLTDPTNPLPARALANRLWHYHFGRGIAGTPNDLGFLGEAPTHPALLDWLAVELAAGGWSLKRLHRTVVTSSAYRQAAASRADAARVDRENLLLWRFPRQRLEGEAIRDAALQAAGLIDLTMGGPSVLPELPQGMDAYGRWRVTTDPAQRNRRSAYVFVRRNLRYPLFQAFDMPDTHESCGRRSVTTTAPQALILLNDKLVLQWARDYARRVAREAGPLEAARVERAYAIAYARRPDSGELELALAFLERQAGAHAARGLVAADGRESALGDLCHVLLNSNEFVYRS